MQEGLLRRAERFLLVHINDAESWDKGGIKGVWQETDGTVCISYENGQWFHYKEEKGRIIWWQGDFLNGKNK